MGIGEGIKGIGGRGGGGGGGGGGNDSFGGSDSDGGFEAGIDGLRWHILRVHFRPWPKAPPPTTALQSTLSFHTTPS